MIVPNNHKEYNQECKRLELNFLGLQYDFDYHVTNYGFDSEALHIGNEAILAKQTFENFRDKYKTQFISYSKSELFNLLFKQQN